MAHSGHTPNLHLPQFLGDDVPNWLTDFNDAMDIIDRNAGDTSESVGAAKTAATQSAASAQSAEASARRAKQAAEGTEAKAQAAEAAAKAANEKSDLAEKTAERALNVANSADATADLAAKTAADALNTASNAAYVAEQAQQTATQAENRAAAAYNKAEESERTASDAKLAADSAIEMATQASDDAQEAQTAAAAAQQSADSIDSKLADYVLKDTYEAGQAEQDSKISAIQSTADTALANAGTAASKAEAAQTAAESADTNAQSAKETAKNALQLAKNSSDIYKYNDRAVSIYLKKHIFAKIKFTSGDDNVTQICLVELNNVEVQTNTVTIIYDILFNEVNKYGEILLNVSEFLPFKTGSTKPKYAQMLTTISGKPQGSGIIDANFIAVGVVSPATDVEIIETKQQITYNITIPVF